MPDYKKLRVWQAAYQLAVDTFKVCGRLRGERRPRLIDQLTGAALSVSGNISEGRARNSTKEFIRFLRYSLTSVDEVESHILIARDAEAMSQEDSALLIGQLVEVRKMLYGLIKKLRDSDDR